MRVSRLLQLLAAVRFALACGVLLLACAGGGARAQGDSTVGDPGDPGVTAPEVATPPAAGPDAVGSGTEEGLEAAGVDAEHAGEEAHGPLPPVWLVLPFVALLAMIATGPLFYAHHWHHHYPKYAVGLGLLVGAYYVLALGSFVPVLHAVEEYISFIALLTALFVASGTILFETDYYGKPRVNTALLFGGAVIANLIGTTGASMLLVRPYMRINKGRLKAYHIIFFIFIVSNVGGALTPIGDPPLFLGFLRGVPFFWTVTHLWYIWLPTVLVLLAVFYVVDRRNTEKSVREKALEEGDPDIVPGEYSELEPYETTSHVVVEGKLGFVWLAVIIGAVFLDPNVFGWVPDLPELLHTPFGLREVIMFAVAFLAYRTANRKALKGNAFSFAPMAEVAWLFIGIFLTMQPALTLIGAFAQANGAALNASTFYFGTGILSSVLDNAPTYVSFVSAGMGKFGLDVNSPADVAAFAAVHLSDPQSWYYLQAISVAAVFWGAVTYIGNGPNFMVKAIAEEAGVQMPSFVGYVVKYSLPILIPIYLLVWLVFFSGYVPIHDF